MTDLVERIGPVVGFLIALTVVAEVADRAGVFDVAGHWAARAARGRVLRLWLLIVVLATVSTIVLSLDTTAVLLTPVVLAVAAQAELDGTVFALTTVWLANTASLLLPVSNLTNLLALHSFSAIPDHPSYLSVMWIPALVAIVATVVVTALLHRRSLRGRFRVAEPASSHDRVLLIVSAAVCIALAPLFVSGVMPVIPASLAAVVLLVTLALRDRAGLRELKVPWKTVVAVVALFAIVDFAGPRGLTHAISAVAGHGDSVLDLLRLGGAAAGMANLVNNLPSYLAVEPATGTAARHAALLVGVNAGSIVTIWGSVATLLWRDRCRRAGLDISLRTFTWQSALVALVVVTSAVLAIG